MLEVADRDDEVSIRDLERQIENLNRDRVRLEDSIKRMETNQVRIFREDASRGKASEQAETLAKPSPCTRKRSRSRSGSAGSEKSAKSAKSAKSSKSTKSKGNSADAEGKEDGGEGKGGEEKAEAKGTEPEKKRSRPSGKADPRNRNFFGKLLGHIHSAKTALEREKGTKAAELNQKAQERIEDKLSVSKTNIKEFRKTQYANKIKEDQAKVVQIAKSIEEKEMLLLQKRLEHHYSLMMNFIRTNAEPTIFYLPAKHTKETERAFEETRAAIKRKLSSLKVELRPIAEDEVAARAAAAAAAASAEPGDAEGKEGDADKEAPRDKEPEKEEAQEPGAQGEKDGAQKPEEEKKEAASDSEEESAPPPKKGGEESDS
mmetsp:Transcript_53060/g.148948  ORF Transcript_53060/g.148948 Transcript_53060/m.148948 type:complete len:374 (+) Transcript_53060:109-1230(+)